MIYAFTYPKLLHPLPLNDPDEAHHEAICLEKHGLLFYRSTFKPLYCMSAKYEFCYIRYFYHNSNMQARI